MKLVPIRDIIAEKISGEWGDEAIDGKGVVVIRTANFLNTGQINFSNLVRRKIDQKKVAKKRLLSGDIIIEKSGGSPTQPVGRVVIFRNPDNDTYLCNNFTSILRPKKNEVHPEYLFYVLHNNHKKGRTLRHQNKTTGIINLKLDSYLGSEIPLPPLNDQIRITHLLGKVEGLIAERIQHLQQLDELLKSVFLEMFGDPVRNEKAWAVFRFAELFAVPPRIGTTKPASGGNGVRVVRVGEIGKLRVRVDHCARLELSPDEFAKCKVELDDILLARAIGSQEQLGKASLIEALEEPLAFDSHVMRIRFDSKLVVPLFAYFWLRSNGGRSLFLKASAKTSVQFNINSKQISSIAIPLPPKPLQERFAVFAERVECLAVSYHQSLSDLEALNGALSQQAFKGELDLSRVPMLGIEPEEEKAVAAEPLHKPAKQGLAINLPYNDNVLDALVSAEAREGLIAQWLEAYRGQLGNTPFSVQHFMAAAQNRLAELHPDNDFELGANDYEHIKAWVFAALAAGTLTQALDDPGNRIEIKAVRA